MNSLKNNKIIKNISISTKMQGNILKGVKNKKRASKVTFLYSKQIAVACCAAFIGMAGMTVHAGIMNWRERMEAMPEQEVEQYVNIVDTRQEGSSYSRSLTEAEHNRMMELLNTYREGTFPQLDLPIVDKVSDLNEGQMGYVNELGVIVMPEAELTDEQLLQMIDYMEKTNFVTGEMIGEEGGENFQEDLPVETTTQARNLAENALVHYFGFDTSSSYRCSIYEYESYTATEHPLYYCVTFESDELASDVSVVFVDSETSEVFMVSHGGWGKYYKSATTQEVEEKMGDYVASAQNYVAQNFPGSGEVGSIYYRRAAWDEEPTCETIYLLMKYENVSYQIEVSAYDASIDSFVIFGTETGYQEQYEAIEWKQVQ